jgi:glycine cleavage system H protein
MEQHRPATLFYKKSHFVAHLPIDYQYSPSHAWISRQPGGILRVGLTKFATRMLGELVDHGFEPGVDSPVASGQIIGWVEGFKAISDLYCTADGAFRGGNPQLKDDLELLGRDPFAQGWLYEVQGTPDPRCFDVHAYVALLDKTIDKILEKQSGEEIV